MTPFESDSLADPQYNFDHFMQYLGFEPEIRCAQDNDLPGFVALAGFNSFITDSDDFFDGDNTFVPNEIDVSNEADIQSKMLVASETVIQSGPVDPTMLFAPLPNEIPDPAAPFASLPIEMLGHIEAPVGPAANEITAPIEGPDDAAANKILAPIKGPFDFPAPFASPPKQLAQIGGSLTRKKKAKDDKRSLHSIVKMVALSLVGAERRPVVHVNNKNQKKMGVSIYFPDHNLVKAGERAGEGRKRLFSPNWNKTGAHRDNYTFIEAVIDEASAMPGVQKGGWNRAMIQMTAEKYFTRMRSIRQRQTGRAEKENVEACSADEL